MTASLEYAIIGSSPQVRFSDNRDCDYRKKAGKVCAMADIATQQPEAIEIFEQLDALDLRQRDLARALGLDENKISKTKAGERLFKAGEVSKARGWLRSVAEKRTAGYGPAEPDLPSVDSIAAYVDVDVLPSYAGAGGGGTGEGDRIIAKLPRRLIEEELRGRPSDFELIDIRGDSAQPDFYHGDQILIDKRDRDPRQPGPFAIWDEDGYVLKLVERIPGRRGWYRIFSANPRYSSYEIEETEATIRGRPVWFARRL
jgi:phage repressor protein C with HTH and peptisase S24 domain